MIYGTDIVLLLLYVSEIKNNTFLQKEVFLAWKEVFPNKIADLAFFPYYFGPYSDILTNITDHLKKKKLIKKISISPKRFKYVITDLGKQIAKQRIDELDIDFDKLRNAKHNWEEFKGDGLMKYVYRNYPYYTSETKRPSLKWS